MAYKIAFFGAKPYDIASFDKVNEKYNYDIRYYKGHLNPNNVVLTQDTDAVCIFVNDTADAAVIDAMVDNGVKLLALRCAGFNNVDLKAAKGKLPVVRVPAYSPYAVAEYSLALMLSLNRKIHRAYWRTRDGNFSLNGLMGFDMHGKTIGIIGTGKIAKILIRLLKGFGMRILAYDLYPDMKFAGEEGISYVSLDELYRESDIISLHCPLTDQTKYMIDKDSIDKMKEGVMIINTGRGLLINTNDLIEGLKEGYIQVISTDHAPHTQKDKTGSMRTAAFGIVGIETSFALSYTALVETGVLTLSQLVEKMSYNPAKILNLPCGTLQEGHPADVVIADIKHPYTIHKADFVSKGKNTPFEGKEVKGKILYTICDGKVVYTDPSAVK